MKTNFPKSTNSTNAHKTGVISAVVTPNNKTKTNPLAKQKSMVGF